MGKYWRALAEYDAETQAFTEAAGVIKSPFSPVEKATLKGVRVVVGRQAATSLTNGVWIKLTCTTFKPNMMDFLVEGNGLATAPAMQSVPYDFEVNQPVEPGVNITIEGRCLEATHVTNTVLVMGMFES
jgi:hypothetical protein